MTDTPTGFDRAPARYTAQGRETIDRMRDLAYVAAQDILDATGADVSLDALASALFAYHCDATALKYEDREGLKGEAAEDRAKGAFYRRMAWHVRGNGPDPRASRPGFVPYARPK